MIVGYILVGSVAGLIASLAALLFGASFWIAFSLYVLVGSATVVMLPLILMLVKSLAKQGMIQGFTDAGHPRGGSQSVDPSPEQLDETIQAPMRILAVDDEPFILKILPMISEKAGFSEVTSATSGEEAMGLLTKSNTIFDCLLIDISMPGMDGIELCRQVRQMPQYHHTPIVMLTAMRDMQNMGDAYRAGATDYATKPFDVEELESRLRLAQKTIRAQTANDPGKDANLNFRHRKRSLGDKFELPQELSLPSAGSLVDLTALSSYLSHLTRKDVAGVQMYGLRIDGIDAIYARYSIDQRVTLLEGLASATIDYFGTDQSVMAYTSDATLLVATTSANPQDVGNIEFDIERRLEDNLSDFDPSDAIALGVSVGGPTRPSAKKAGRAEAAAAQVTALTEDRELDKQGRQVAGLFSR